MCSVTLCRVAARGSGRRSPENGPNQAEITTPLTLGPPRVYRVLFPANSLQVPTGFMEAVVDDLDRQLQKFRDDRTSRFWHSDLSAPKAFSRAKPRAPRPSSRSDSEPLGRPGDVARSLAPSAEIG
jgi:hypothetical protein